MFISRGKFDDKSSISSYRLIGEGYIVLNSSLIKSKYRSSIVMKIKTASADGLIFLAFTDKNNFMSIELKGGYIVYKVRV